MTNCTQESFEFPVLKRRIVEANFQGGDITSDGGVLLLQQVDRRLGGTPETGAMNHSNRYFPELQERGVRLVLDHEGQDDSQWAAM